MNSNTEFWTSHIEALRREGVATTVYAKQHGLSLAALYYWRRKLNAAGEAGAGAGKFVSLRLVGAAPPACAPHCTLLLVSGLRLEMAALPSPAWLAAFEQARSGAR